MAWSGSEPRSNVPAPATSFLGRREALAQLDALYAGGARLVSVIGPPGMGKTRLSVRYAELQADRETWLCDLAEAKTVAHVCDIIASTLGLGGRATDVVLDLARAIALRGAMLIVLDNCEQAIDPIARTVATCMELAPLVSFLITSREVLKVRGEHVVDLDPLNLSTDGVQLFVDRARACGRPIVDGELPIVGDIVKSVDGIPLAIELAAARLSAMSPRDLRDRLSNQLELLSDGPRDAAARHRTMRAAIAWSWAMLSPAEKTAFHQCSVFHGGFTLTAAEQVLGVSAGVLQSLREKSLLRVDGTRFGMFESLREFAADELARSGETDAIRSRHAAYYVTRATECAASDSIDVLDHLVADLENVVAVIEHHLASSSSAEQLVEALVALELVYRTRGPLSSYAALLDRGVERVSNEPIAVASRARLLIARAATRHECGREDEARGDAEHALALARETADRTLIGRATFLLAQVNYYADSETALRHYRDALDIHREVSDVSFERLALYNIAEILADRGQFAAAIATKQQSIDVCRASRNLRAEARSLAALGKMHLGTGDLVTAERILDESIAILRRIDDRQFVGVALGAKAAVYHEQARPVEARAQYTEALRLLREAQNPCNMFVAADFARLEHEERCYGDARADIEEALRGATEVRDRRGQALCLAQLASVEAALDHIAAAESLLERARAFARDELDPAVLATVRVYGGVIALARTRAHLADDAVKLAVESHELAQHTLREGEATASATMQRSACRLVARAVGRSRALLFGSQCRWFIAPGSTKQIAMTDREAPRRILLALARLRIAHPGRTLAMDALIESGWPGERVESSSAAGRVYTSIATLRRRGLRTILANTGDGYKLDPDVAVVLARGDEP